MKPCCNSRSFQKIKVSQESISSLNNCFCFQIYMSLKRIQDIRLLYNIEKVLKALPLDSIKRWKCNAQKFKYTEAYGTRNGCPEGEVLLPLFSLTLTINLKATKNLQYIFIFMNGRDSVPITSAILCSLTSAILNIPEMSMDSDWTNRHKN